MKVNNTPYRTIWPASDGWAVEIIDQTKLPHHFETVRLENLTDSIHAIADMLVRGAPLIGATAAWGIALAMHENASDLALQSACEGLYQARPTAVNLRWALDEMRKVLDPLDPSSRREAAYARAMEITDDDVEISSSLGEHGSKLIKNIWEGRRRDSIVNVLTHCNAGWLATVDWGTALAPIYKAHNAGIPVHVWVDETRPRNQGASLTAWELKQHGVPHTLIADNVGGHLMQHGKVDLCITGTDRTTRTGDVCNKIGTYLKALAAHDNNVPFYVALPGTTIDWTLRDGVAEIPIEERDADEVLRIPGMCDDGVVREVLLTAEGVTAANYAFDVTPARLVTGLITERGVCAASESGLSGLYPDLA
ncbi:MAG: S-methyl-5-thioribose-1-phosphate isomerase [Rhodospirillales bacterium]|jgi:methylthioribose-1-phosphate isomerase|nr:S-methyl-5-thioribose-1-phosphate isomerase [Rhodospirillales bacterium]